MSLVAAIATFEPAVRRTGIGAGRSSPRASQQARASTDRKLAARARGIDRAAVGVNQVARDLGAEFGMSREAILAQKDDLHASWGNLTIAHTFAAGDRGGMTVAQLLQLHDRGMGWGQIAAGLRFNMRDAVTAVNSASGVATGVTKAGEQAVAVGGE